MDKDKKPFKVMGGGKPDGEVYEKEFPTTTKEFWESITSGSKWATLVNQIEIAHLELEKLANRCEQDPNVDVRRELQKLIFKYAKGTPKGSYRLPRGDGLIV